MSWTAQAPSNIALIKYMGKTSHKNNLPTNPSLSYTLNHLLTCVDIEPNSANKDEWQPLEKAGYEAPQLSAKATDRFLSHWQFLRNRFELDGSFIIKSGNNFPSDCGLASSASSFAALTMAAHEVYLTQKGRASLSPVELAKHSRQGSGSSCRSFFPTWALWDAEGAMKAEIPYKDLLHQVVIVEKQKKQVSSSEAHERVTSSLLFRGRPERAEERMRLLIDSLQKKEWTKAFELTWAEFWDMHALFESSDPPFGYMKGPSMTVLDNVRHLWQEQGDGPLVTMDAGANVHLLYRSEQLEVAKEVEQSMAALGFELLKSY